MTILEKMIINCSEAGYTTTKNVEKIAKAKKFMFGDEQWTRCPCDGENYDRYCISDLCRSDIERDGICHCNCYAKKDK